MKSSLKFREEKSPLLRAKVPFKLGPIPLSSGIAVGTRQDLALHFGTGFSWGPIIKLAFKPHHPTPLSLVLKSGLGLWGSPNDAPFVLRAEIGLTPKVHDRLLSVHIKPRFGDFSIRKDIKNVNFWLPQQKEPARTSVQLQLHENGEENHVITPQMGENGAFLSSISNGDVKVKGIDELDGEADMSRFVPHERLHLHMKKKSHKSFASFSLAGAHDALRGCRVVTHSSLPLGSQFRLNIQWGVNAASDFLQEWDGSLPSLSFARLPSLLLEKISFEQVVSHMEKSPAKSIEHGSRGFSEQGLFPSSFAEENRELAQVATLCYTMKRQQQLMHAENQVLRRAMEDMKSHVDSTKSSSWITESAADRILKDSQSMQRPSKSSPVGAPSPSWVGAEGSNRDIQVQKAKKVVPKREDMHSKSFPTGSSSDDVSKELEKAILSAQNGSNVGKKE